MSVHKKYLAVTDFLLLVILLIGTVSQATSRRVLYDAKTVNVSHKFEEWIVEHQRVYSSKEEKRRRFAIFKTKLESIENFNRHGSNTSFYLGLNYFSDMTVEEFMTDYTCKYQQPSNNTTTTFEVPTSWHNIDDVDYEECIFADWSLEMSPVRAQYACGSCWAMASVAAVEGLNRITYGVENVAALSPQQLIDCTTDTNYGCAGGWANEALDYIRPNGGITSEASSPYTATNGTCNTVKAQEHAASISGYKRLYPSDEDTLAKAVCMQPVTASVAATFTNFRKYKGGVFDGECGPKLDHTVTVVGLGQDENTGQQYWKMLNS